MSDHGRRDAVGAGRAVSVQDEKAQSQGRRQVRRGEGEKAQQRHGAVAGACGTEKSGHIHKHELHTEGNYGVRLTHHLSELPGKVGTHTL